MVHAVMDCLRYINDDVDGCKGVTMPTNIFVV